jgi:hypothetical protein
MGWGRFVIGFRLAAYRHAAKHDAEAHELVSALTPEGMSDLVML